MAVNIELTYGKKLGLPEYSSHNFSVSLKAEVARLEDVPGEVERVYQILQASVYGQIVNAGFVPGGEARPPARNGGSSNWMRRISAGCRPASGRRAGRTEAGGASPLRTTPPGGNGPLDRGDSGARRRGGGMKILKWAWRAHAAFRCSFSRGISSTRLQGRQRLSSWNFRMSSHASLQAPVEPGSANR